MTALAVVLILASLSTGQLPREMAPKPRMEYPQEYYHSFKGNAEKVPGIELFGPDAEQCVKLEPAGARITLGPGHEAGRPNIGLITRFAVQGDFEITVRYEILHEPQPADTPKQTRFTLFVPLDGLGPGRATLSRRTTAEDGHDFFAWLSLGKGATKNQQGDVFPAELQAGQLRLVRNGSVLTYCVAEGEDGAFKQIATYAFGTEDLKDVRIVGSTGGPLASLDVRVLDLRIRAEGLPNVPAATKERASRMLWLVAALVLVFVATIVVLTLWLHKRQQSSKGI